MIGINSVTESQSNYNIPAQLFLSCSPCSKRALGGFNCCECIFLIMHSPIQDTGHTALLPCMHVVFCQNRTSDTRIIGSYNAGFPFQKAFMYWLQKAVIKRRAEGSQMSGIVLFQWLEVIFSHICFTSECQNDINFDWCQCAPFVNLLVCCCERKCWKEDFKKFFK